ncbi:uncharacterized protein LOC103703229 [Phoenix dactylifera]|uniref:Uncharacterized protein LOC103703229 n=1 Tax=Phoenix dactylifera TaxID=42345 RepID=A0A8B7BSB9_PHODC|nr:uncharacterized protein LOC103703229 [Phoenix dactylifera]
MAGFWSPGCLYFPAPPMLVAPPSNFLANRPLSMEQSLTNLGLQSNRPGAAFTRQHTLSLLQSDESMTSFLLSELLMARDRMMELESRLKRAEEERETWQRIAREHEAMIASLEQLREPSVGSSPAAGDAVSCTGHPLAVEEPREGTGMGLFKACGSPDSHVLPLPGTYRCAYELCAAFLGPCPHRKR